jgi:putative ABC transport system substrate-binding protein
VEELLERLQAERARKAGLVEERRTLNAAGTEDRAPEALVARLTARAAEQSQLADAGCLLAYGPDTAEIYRQAARFVDKIPKGAKPGDLPIEQPTKYKFVINLKTAKALGLTIPPSLLARADEVIQ